MGQAGFFYRPELIVMQPLYSKNKRIKKFNGENLIELFISMKFFIFIKVSYFI